MPIKVGEKMLMTLKEAAEYFGVSRRLLSYAVNKDKRLKAIVYGHYRLVTPEDVARWMAEFYHPQMAQRARKRWQDSKKKSERA